MGVSDKVVDVVVDQVRGYIEPSAGERACAYELFVVLHGSVVDAPLRAGRGTVRGYLDGLAAVQEEVLGVLRTAGREASEGSGGNLSVAVLTLRVLREVVRPAWLRWDGELAAHEVRHRGTHPDATAADCEATWPQAELARTDLREVRSHLRQFQYTLARVAGLSATALQAVPPSASIDPTPVGVLPDPPPGARPQPMVRWLALRDLFGMARAHRRTGAARDVTAPPVRPAACFATGTSQPVAQTATPPAALPGAVPVPAEEAGGFVFDYVADLGDGFDPTMAVAWFLGRRSLRLPEDPDHERPRPPAPLPRASLLVLGGDEVYPAASREGYRDRTDLPYTLGWEPDPATDGTRPAVVALPGNHDWLGGIEAFEQQFVTAAQFATHWDAPQDRRYWAVQLPQGWWLWGVDTGVELGVETAAGRDHVGEDDPLGTSQSRYFDTAATWLRRGDQVVVCTPVPMWQLRQRDPAAYRSLRSSIERRVVPQGATIPLWLSGDSHFFATYERVDGESEECHVTAGGGGAFLQPTHNLPERIPHEQGAAEFSRTASWPGPNDSESLLGGAASLRSPSLWWLAVVAAGLHAAYQWLGSRTSGRIAALSGADRPGWRGTVQDALGDAVASPWTWLLLAVVVAGGVLAVKTNSRENRLRSAGRLYGLGMGVAIAATFVVLAALRQLVDPTPSGWLSGLSWLVGGAGSVAVFLWASGFVNRRIWANDTLGFASAPSTRFKHFLRCRIDRTGALTCHVIGIDPVGDGWERALHDTRLVPPPDEAGLPRLHYVWGRRFAPRVPSIDVTVSISRSEDPACAPETDERIDTVFRLLCRRLIEDGHRVLYGGRPREDFTAELAAIERKRYQDDVGAPAHLLNYVADYLWRPALADDDLVHVHVVRGDRAVGESPVDRQVRDLTAMRERLTADAHLRICIGGATQPRTAGVRIAPGIVEEAALSIRHGKPLVVAGGFGGASALVADALQGGLAPERVALLADAYLPAAPGRLGLDDLLGSFTDLSVLRNGLTDDENLDLLSSEDPAAVVELILRAVRGIARASVPRPSWPSAGG